MLSPVITISIFQKQAAPQIYSAGQVIFEEGQSGDCMFGIVEGEVDILVKGKVVETITDGNIFGTGVLVWIKNRTYTAIAKTDCNLISLDEKRFLFAVQEAPMFALHVIKNYSERLSRLQHMV
ncbi:cyclic nucleotide-binding domain-containing protein [Fortiea sp. LEGE XX443]|uniref:cyclic nucleotide-binding domain-containing protein n=1 Tax=Fortiea sp. LEGE XX443 TaxID=1828611 RepID=UPI0018819EBE|nr:cyclic nucleotide-binding domain-containing protein [Fortiea sp. LEGE XX443]MBE9006142.1 cyclic nucleotide-binding domain-containing protein [Fortiea sp. LEGE XX443]